MKTRLFAFAALAFALAACNNDNSEVLNTDGPVAARFTADIDKSVSTRVNPEGSGFTDGDCIGITGAGYTNVPYTRENGRFVPDGTTIYYNGPEDYTFSAYYPYKADSELTDGMIAATTDATAQQDQPAIDFLFASGAVGSTHNPEVKFTGDHAFRHCMSQITLTFEAGDGVDFSVVRPESYTLDGLKLDGSFDTATGIAAADEGAQAGELSIELADGNLTSSVILFPQTAVSLPLVVNYNSEEYNATLTVPDGALQAGNNYTWTVKVNNKVLDVGSATIKAWNDISSGEGEATILDYTISADGRTYTVYNAKGLLAWNEAVQSDLTLNCTLAADINMTGIDWTPMGYYDYENWQYIGYTGTFDGGGHTITGLTVDLPNQGYVGLIGCLGGTVQNLTLAGVEINGSGYVGGVAGGNSGTVTGCAVSGKVSGNSLYIGGVVGYNAQRCTVTGCYAAGDVSGGDYVGGVVGCNIGTVTACYHTAGEVSGNGGVGGVVGQCADGSVTVCYWSNNLDAGIGYIFSGNGDVTKVDGTDVTWVDAQKRMNEAIGASGRRYAETDAETPPTLEPVKD